jgi:histidinol-phosphate aminotransferase
MLTPFATSLPATVPFTGPEALERRSGIAFRARLGANESLFGPSPVAIAAMAKAASDVWMYGDPETHDLKAAIARHHGISPANIVVGEGIDALLGNLVRLTVAPGDAVVTSDGAYPTFNFHVTGYGGSLHKVPYRGNHEDPDALISMARDTAAKLIYLANPDNPMGSHHPAQTLQSMIQALPDRCLLVLDEAYVDLAPPGTAPQIAPDDPRVIRLRTFSKAYGLAGLRVGYAIAHPDLVSAFDRVRLHFGVGRVAQAGAMAALQDQDWLAHVQQQVTAARIRLGQIAVDNHLLALPSATNFVTVDCGRVGNFARSLLHEMGNRGVFLRMPGVAPLDRCLRIGLGPAPDLDILAETLPLALAAVSA